MQKYIRTILSLLLAMLAGGRAWGQTWNVVIDDAFTGRTTPTSANATNGTNVGSPPTFNAPATGGAWIDVAGNTWAINTSNVLVGTNVSANGVNTYRLTRPSVEQAQDQRCVVTTGLSYPANSNWCILLRVSSTTYYMFQSAQTSMSIYKVVSGTPSLVTGASASLSPAMSNANQYTLDAQVTGANPTNFYFRVTRTSDNVVLGTIGTAGTSTVQDSTSGLQVASGGYGLSLNSAGTGVATPFAHVTTYYSTPGLSGAVPALSSSSPAGIVISHTAASGGTGPYIYNLYRSTTENFSIGSGNLLASGATFPYTDSTAQPNTIYYYKERTTDSAASTADSVQVPATVWTNPLIIGFIGDSISFGYGLSTPNSQAFPIVEGQMLQRRFGIRAVTVVNKGVTGADTSTGASGWGPSTAYYASAKTAFIAASVTHISILLGANDARSPNTFSVSTYQTNLQNIITQIHTDFPSIPIILNAPIYAVPNSNPGGSTWVEVDTVRLRSYQGALANLVAINTGVYLGDTASYAYFAQHASELQDGVHPNALGAISLAHLEAEAFYRNVLMYGTFTKGIHTGGKL